MPQQLITCTEPKSPVAESFRTLRTNLQFCQHGSSLKTIMFTSAGPNEGKSTVIANTAAVIAQSGKSVLLIDADLRKPTLHRLFDRPNRGLTNYLLAEASDEGLLQTTHLSNLTLLTSGPVPPNPSELLGLRTVEQFLESLKQRFDYVLIDSAPVVAVTDACVLAARVDGIVLVLDAGSVRPEMAQRAKDLLEQANGRLLGVVLNKAEIAQHLQYYYYYGREAKSG